MRPILATLAFAFPLVSVAAPAPDFEIRPRVIYGDDDRRDLYEIKDPAWLAAADSTVALFKSSDIEPQKGLVRLKTDAYGDGYSLCRDEPFYEQRSGAFCSGFLVGPDLLVTAGHCVTSGAACKGTNFVFGFGVARPGELPEMVPAEEVYSCKELLGREQVGTGADWALIRLDRAVPNHAPLEMNLTEKAAKGTPLVVIGHPAGLPTKVAGGASVRDPNLSGYFTANLDTYGGNSGSAVFNAETGKVEGILVRGERDFVWDSQKNCRVSNVCSDDGCRGEDVTKISAVKMPQQSPKAR